MSREIIEALRQIEKEKGISAETLLSALEDALHSAYRKSPDAVETAKVEIDPETGDIRVFQLASPELGDRILDTLASHAAAVVTEILDGTLPPTQWHSPLWPHRFLFVHPWMVRFINRILSIPGEIG